MGRDEAFVITHTSKIRIPSNKAVAQKIATLPLSPQRDSTANAAPTPQAGSMESGSQVSLENGDWVYFACSNDMGLVAVF